MFSNHRILFPVDFSEHLFNVPQAVGKLLDRPDVEVILLHVIDGAAPSASKMACGLETLDLLARRHFNRFTVRRRLDHGQPAERILDYIRDNEIEMVVIPARETSSFGKGSFGHVANQIVAEADCPVWLEWPAASQKKAVSPAGLRICCAIEGSRHDETLIRDSALIADGLHGDLTIISSISPRPKDSDALFRDTLTGGEEVLREMERIDKLRPRIASRAEVTVAAGWREAVIGRAVREQRSDLLITGNCRKTIQAAEGACPVLRLGRHPGRAVGLFGDYRKPYRKVA
ncbi:MAG: universal stress protein [Terriglobia bacterium]